MKQEKSLLPLMLRDGFLMEFERLDEALGGFCGRSQQGFDKTSGLGLVQLDGIVTANDFLSSVTDMGDNERGEGRTFQRCGAGQ